ncbi:DUF1918 domain-containing protein [Streptomyces sp. NBC_01497]|uniref:DUF1918 domain-containing protein n=1 Tax=Streptomyces sp. NBC_01497 TaxID=2903885 RepID=UPI002E32D2BE|nr:DUF1918 domain-containing protein [Streptomyces sp. NBC_01497]
MRARVGDRLVVHGRTVGKPDHMVEVVEVLGSDGGPPYRVRSDDGHETIMTPGPDTVVDPQGGTGQG